MNSSKSMAEGLCYIDTHKWCPGGVKESSLSNRDEPWSPLTTGGIVLVPVEEVLYHLGENSLPYHVSVYGDIYRSTMQGLTFFKVEKIQIEQPVKWYESIHACGNIQLALERATANSNRALVDLIESYIHPERGDEWTLPKEFQVVHYGDRVTYLFQRDGHWRGLSCILGSSIGVQELAFNSAGDMGHWLAHCRVTDKSDQYGKKVIKHFTVAYKENGIILKAERGHR